MAKKKRTPPKRLPGKRIRKKSPPKKASGKGAASGSREAGSAEARSGSRNEIARAIALLVWTHEMTGKLCAGVPEHQLTAQATPADNHILWQIGHLASSYAWFASMLDGKSAKLGETFDTLFGFGSKPVADPGAYPDHAMVRKVHDDQFQRLVSAAQQLDDDQATAPLPKEAGTFATSKLDAIQKCIWHEGWHQGQMSALRRALGLPNAM